MTCNATFGVAKSPEDEPSDEVDDSSSLLSPPSDDDGKSQIGARIVRYMNAAHVLAYIHLTKSSYMNAEKMLYPFCDMHGLLSRQELHHMNRLGHESAGITWQTAILWALRNVQIAKEKGYLPATTSPSEETLKNSIVGLRCVLQSLYGTAGDTAVRILLLSMKSGLANCPLLTGQPVPFMYYNLLSWLNWCFQVTC